MGNDNGSDGRTKLIFAGVIIVLLLIFVAQNTESAHVNFLIFDANVSLWFVIVACAALGFVAGWFVGRSRLRR